MQVAGRPLSEVGFPEGAIVGALLRNGAVIIPTGKEILRPGDAPWCSPSRMPWKRSRTSSPPESLNPRVIIRVNAGVILALGLALLVPLALSLLYRDGSWASFLLPADADVGSRRRWLRASPASGRAPGTCRTGTSTSP